MELLRDSQLDFNVTVHLDRKTHTAVARVMCGGVEVDRLEKTWFDTPWTPWVHDSSANALSSLVRTQFANKLAKLISMIACG